MSTKIDDIILKYRKNNVRVDSYQDFGQHEALFGDAEALEVQAKKQQIKSKDQDIKERFKYASRIYWYTVFASIVIILLVVVNGYFNLISKTFLKEPTLVALISLLGVDIVGMLVIVLRYLFYNGNSK